MKKIIILLIFLISSNVIAQNLNSYKYIIIPTKYEFLNVKDQYKLNSLTKFLFEKENFTVLYKDEKIPNDLYENPCLGIHTHLIKTSSLFYTFLNIELKDCNNQIVFTSKKGRSKLKEYKRSYHEALRKAFASVKLLNYKYDNLKKVPKQEVEVEVQKTVPTVTETTVNFLKATKTKSGFIIVNKNSKVNYEMITSSVTNVFHLKNKEGIIYKKNNNWFFEVTSNNKIITKKLNIKF